MKSRGIAAQKKKNPLIFLPDKKNRQPHRKEAFMLWKQLWPFQCLEVAALCSLCDSTVSFNLTKAQGKQNEEKMRFREMETSAPLCYCISPAKLFCITFGAVTLLLYPLPAAWQILLLPFAFVFWISPANQCLQPEWPYFMFCELADRYPSARLSPPPFRHPA